MTLPDVSSNVLVVWVAIVATGIIAAGYAAEKGLGPIGRWWFGLAEQRRTAAEQREDADIRELKRQASNLAAANEWLHRRVSSLEQYDVEHTQLLVQHAGWDYHVQQALAQHGITVPTPPPLRPQSGPHAPQRDATP